MMRKMEWQWELLHRNEHSETSRAKFYGGWMVLTQIHDRSRLTSTSVFVSDPNHQWVITNLPKPELKDG